MTKIEIQGLGKKFNREWIFRNLSHTIEAGSKTAIIGANGSGKSTLTQNHWILFTYKVKGQVIFSNEGKVVETDDFQLSINFAAPYFNVIEEYTLSEFLAFHEQFKTPIVDIKNTLEQIGLEKAQE